MNKHKRMPDQDMLDNMWATYISIEGPDRAWFEFAIRCELGEPTLVGEPIFDDDGDKIGQSTYWRYDQYRGTTKTWLARLKYGVL